MKVQISEPLTTINLNLLLRSVQNVLWAVLSECGNEFHGYVWCSWVEFGVFLVALDGIDLFPCFPLEIVASSLFAQIPDHESKLSGPYYNMC